MHQIYEPIENHNLYLSYFGSFSDTATSDLMDLVQAFLSEDETKRPFQKRLPFIVAECYQNLVRHGQIEELSKRFKSSEDNIQIAANEEEINITSINVIERERIPRLTEAINTINSLSKDELREYRMLILNTGSFSKKGGAGLGLIEMARKTGYPIRYKFVDIDDEYARFYMTLDVVFNGQNKPQTPIETYEKLYNEQVLDRFIFIFKGDFGEESNENLLGLLETKYIENENLDFHEVERFQILVEMLQNVAKHGAEHKGRIEGTLGIKLTPTGQQIVVGNYIPSAKRKFLIDYLNEINGLDSQALKTRYLKEMSKLNDSPDHNGGFGLLQIARLVKHPLDFVVHSLDEKKHFLSFQVTHEPS